jgi:hypothetical protein
MPQRFPRYSLHPNILHENNRFCNGSVLHSQHQISEYNRKRGHIGGGVNFFNSHHMFNNYNPASSTGMQGLAQMEASSNT